MNEYRRVGFIGLFMLFAAGFRLLWQAHPSLFPCLGLWVSFGLVLILAITWKEVSHFVRFSWSIIAIGGSLNAVVTIANGGFMPTAGIVQGAYIHGGTLAWLGDFYWGGASPGDIIMVLGFSPLIYLVFLSWCRRNRAKIVQ